MKFLPTKIHQFIYLLLFLVFISCSSDEEVNIVYPEGGYSYLKNVEPNDTNFYFLPIRHLIPKQDTFLVLDGKYCFDAFNEPNLSMKAPKEDIFRFSYGCSFCGKYAFMTLTKNKVVLKANKTGVPYPLDRIELLSPIEKEHYHLLDMHYPLQKASFTGRKKIYIDSLIKKYPELMNPSYFLTLKKKVSIPYHVPFSYSTRTIPISVEKFKYFVTQLNNSEFWQRPYKVECRNMPMDGDGFYLEAITKQKYHLVSSNYCLDEDGQSKFKKVSEDLLKFIGFDLQAFYAETKQ